MFCKEGLLCKQEQFLLCKIFIKNWRNAVIVDFEIYYVLVDNLRDILYCIAF